MSYIIIKVYDFECDQPRCGRICDIETEPNIAAALKQLQERERWTVKGRKHYCPEHRHQP